MRMLQPSVYAALQPISVGVDLNRDRLNCCSFPHLRLWGTLTQDSRDWWDELIEEESYPATAEGLAEFIHDSLEPLCARMVAEVEYTPAIKAQTLGEGLQAHRLEKLNRYETHLDRKFERTLAMLLKLKDIRSA